MSNWENVTNELQDLVLDYQKLCSAEVEFSSAICNASEVYRSTVIAVIQNLHSLQIKITGREYTEFEKFICGELGKMENALNSATCSMISDEMGAIFTKKDALNPCEKDLATVEGVR